MTFHTFSKVSHCWGAMPKNAAPTDCTTFKVITVKMARIPYNTI